MRNLLGRLHARRLPELLRIADAWAVPLHGESKSEVVGTLYRAMTDPRTMRDVWDRLDPAHRAMASAMADAPDAVSSPTVEELAARLEIEGGEARETALQLFRAGILAREGDDEPLPIGTAPRLLMPREIALNIRRLQDEMAAGDLTQSPLRVLIELLDDAELEAAARIWGLRAVPGVARRGEIATRLLRLVNDGNRVERVVKGRGRDAAVIWKMVRAATEPIDLAKVAATTGLGGHEKQTVSRLRAALTELEGALLVWHAYRDGTRRLFVPAEIRTPGEAPAAELPGLVDAQLEPSIVPPWRHPDAAAWDLLTLLRIVSDRQAPVWEAGDDLPRWLVRSAQRRLWFRGGEGPPVGYLELLRALGLAEGILAIDEETRPPRIVVGPQARLWRGQSFQAQTTRLRERWLHLPRWIEGEAAALVEIWGANWRGMRPRLLAALAAPEMEVIPGRWVTLESLALRLAARSPTLLGSSFSAATARIGGEAGAGGDEREARTAALSDVIAIELAGPFAWFGITEIIDAPGRARAVRLTDGGARLAAGKTPLTEDDSGTALPALRIAGSGEVALQTPSPDRVWALSAFAEPVDLGQESHYRLTAGSIAGALAAGIEREQIVAFLERGSRQPLPSELAANLTSWARGYRRVRMRRAVILNCDDPAEQPPLLEVLRDGGWTAEVLGDRAVLVFLSETGASDSTVVDHGEEALMMALRTAGHAPHWDTASNTASGLPPDSGANYQGEELG